MCLRAEVLSVVFTVELSVSKTVSNICKYSDICAILLNDEAAPLGNNYVSEV